jgi:hypothetical protein
LTSRILARRRGHPFDLGWALTIGGELFGYLGEPDEWLKRIDEADRIAHENSLSYVAAFMVPLSSGTALIRKGQVSEGTALAEKGLAVYEEGGGRCNSPYGKSCWPKAGPNSAISPGRSN